MYLHICKYMPTNTCSYTHTLTHITMSWAGFMLFSIFVKTGSADPTSASRHAPRHSSMPRHSRALVTFSEMFAQGSPSGNEPLFPRDHVTSPSKSPPSRDLHAQLHSRTARPHQEHLIENHRIQFRFSHDPALSSSHLSRSLTPPHPEISRNKEDL